MTDDLNEDTDPIPAPSAEPLPDDVRDGDAGSGEPDVPAPVEGDPG